MKQTCKGTPRLHIIIEDSLTVSIKDHNNKPVKVVNVEEEDDWYEKLTLSNIDYFVCFDNTEDVLSVAVYLDDCYEKEVCCSVERLSDVA